MREKTFLREARMIMAVGILVSLGLAALMSAPEELPELPGPFEIPAEAEHEVPTPTPFGPFLPPVRTIEQAPAAERGIPETPWFNWRHVG